MASEDTNDGQLESCGKTEDFSTLVEPRGPPVHPSRDDGWETLSHGDAAYSQPIATPMVGRYVALLTSRVTRMIATT